MKTNKSISGVSRFLLAATTALFAVAAYHLAGAADSPPATSATNTNVTAAASVTATNSVSAGTNAAPAAAVPDKKLLTGAELYSIHCNRCHPERYPSERTASEWRPILLHMQVRAQIPPSQAKLILQYLQENSGR